MKTSEKIFGLAVGP